MKEAMWKVDPMGDFSFSDATDPNQPMLFNFDPNMAPLTADLVTKFGGARPVPVRNSESYVEDETSYLRKHMGEALKQLEGETGKLAVADTKTNGQKRRGKAFPNELVLTVAEDLTGPNRWSSMATPLLVQGRIVLTTHPWQITVEEPAIGRSISMRSHESSSEILPSSPGF